MNTIVFDWPHQWHLILNSHRQKIILPTAKTNTNSVLPVSQDKFGHVIWNYTTLK